jgi:hypothetical protein
MLASDATHVPTWFVVERATEGHERLQVKARPTAQLP